MTMTQDVLASFEQVISPYAGFAPIIAQNSPTEGPLPSPNALTMGMTVGHDGSERPL
jgi:hypothetical protein